MDTSRNTDIGTTSVVGGAVSIIVVFGLNRIAPGTPVDPVVGTAIGVVATFLIGLFVKPKPPTPGQ